MYISVVVLVGAGVFWGFLSLSAGQASNTLRRCASLSDCPGNSSCTPVGCDYECICDEGFRRNGNVECIRAANLGESCVQNASCAVFGFCDSDTGLCSCVSGTRESGADRCAPVSESHLGEQCDGDVNCSAELTCQGAVCLCPAGHRSKTDEDRRILQENFMECLPVDYSINQCGTVLLPSLQTVTSQQPRTNSSLTRTSNIFQECSTFVDCPANSTCTASSCLGYLCICDRGYRPNAESTGCVRALNLGEGCVPGGASCPDRSACDSGVCTCNRGFRSEGASRCLVEGLRGLGQNCGPARPCLEVCVDGVCACGPSMRSKTDEEFRIIGDNLLDCLPLGYSVDKCNGTPLTVPSGLQTTFPAAAIASQKWSLAPPFPNTTSSSSSVFATSPSSTSGVNGASGADIDSTSSSNSPPDWRAETASGSTTTAPRPPASLWSLVIENTSSTGPVPASESSRALTVSAGSSSTPSANTDFVLMHSKEGSRSTPVSSAGAASSAPKPTLRFPTGARTPPPPPAATIPSPSATGSTTAIPPLTQTTGATEPGDSEHNYILGIILPTIVACVIFVIILTLTICCGIPPLRRKMFKGIV